LLTVGGELPEDGLAVYGDEGAALAVAGQIIALVGEVIVFLVVTSPAASVRSSLRSTG